MDKLTATQVEAFIGSVEFLAETFNGEIEGSLVDTFRASKLFDDFTSLFSHMIESIEDNPLAGLSIEFTAQANFSIGTGSCFELYLDEENSVKIIYIHLENGNRFLTFSHGGLILTDNQLFGRFNKTEFMTIRDNILPNGVYAAGKMIDAFPVRAEMQKVKTYASLTWQGEGIDNKVLSDIKTICSFVEKVQPESKAEKLSYQYLPNGLESWELLEASVADALCNEVSESIPDNAYIDIVESEALGFFGCRFSKHIAEWGKKFKADDLYLDVYSGTPVSDALLVLYSDTRQQSYVEIHINHYDICHPVIYDLDALFSAIEKAAEGDAKKKAELISEIVSIVKSFNSYFSEENSLYGHLAQDLASKLQEQA